MPATCTPPGGTDADGCAPPPGLVRCELRGTIGRCPDTAKGWPSSLGEALGEAVVDVTGMPGSDVLVHVSARNLGVTACVTLCGEGAVAAAEALASAVNSGALLQDQPAAASPVDPALRQLLQRGVLFQAFQVTARHEWRLDDFKEQLDSAPVVSSSPFTLAGARHLSLHLHLHGRNQKERPSTTAALMMSAHAASRIACPFLFVVGDGAQWIGPFGRLDRHNVPGSTVCEVDDLLMHADSKGTLIISVEAARWVASAGTRPTKKATPRLQRPRHRSERRSCEPRAAAQEVLAEPAGPADVESAASSPQKAPVAARTAPSSTAPAAVPPAATAAAVPAPAPAAVRAASEQAPSATPDVVPAALPTPVLAAAPAPVLAAVPAAVLAPVAAPAAAAAAPAVAPATVLAAARPTVPVAVPSERGAAPGQQAVTPPAPAAALPAKRSEAERRAADLRARACRLLVRSFRAGELRTALARQHASGSAAPRPQAAARPAPPKGREAADAESLLPSPAGLKGSLGGPAWREEPVSTIALQPRDEGVPHSRPTVQGIITRLSDPAGALARLRAQMADMESESGRPAAALPTSSGSSA